MDKKAICAPIDCGHKYLCAECISKVKKCPICYKRITQKCEIVDNFNNKCMVCETLSKNTATHALLPCGHQIVCKDCSTREITKCPIPHCGKHVTTILQIFDNQEDKISTPKSKTRRLKPHLEGIDVQQTQGTFCSLWCCSFSPPKKKKKF
jgi:hypothetical protein